MSLIDEHHINKNSTETASDFNLLLAQAIEIVQRLTGQTWTDYNLHDPGITILEQICYAITDLVYRTDFPIEDLLTDSNGNINRAKHAFFDKEEVLTCNPITINDLRKVILDKFDELDNVMLIPIKSNHSSKYIKGLYKIILQLNKIESDKIKQDIKNRHILEQKIINYYLSKRNLSEDILSDITILKPQEIQIFADIIIKYNTTPEEVLVNIYNKLDSFLNPKINFYSEKELLARGMKTEEIYCGPLLKNGFIPDEELKPILETIDPIEITNIISQVEGVVFVKKISINEDIISSWKPYKLDDDSCPRLDYSSFCKTIKLFIDDYSLHLNEDLFNDLISRTQQLKPLKNSAFVQTGNKENLRIGSYRSTVTYYTLQNNFPLVYGIGNEGLSLYETDERKALARQLKAYLLFFEQIMANYLAQLSNLDNLYSANLSEIASNTYFHQPLYNIPRINELLTPFTTNNTNNESWENFMANTQNEYITTLDKAIESPEVYFERKERILDHLLARFNIQLNGLPVLLYFNLYIGGNNNDKSKFILEWKANFLNHIVNNNSTRIKAFNYLEGDISISGFENNIAMYLHINRHSHRKLTSIFESGKIAFLAEKGKKTDSSWFQEDLISTRYNGEDISIISRSDEVLSLGNIDKLIAGGIHHEYGYIFRYQKIDILRYGIDITNYKIVPASLTEYIIIYKAPEESKWLIISRHTSKISAIESLNKLIDYLRKISTDSEGFHIMEHILLRPDLHLPTFGFRFRSSKNEILFQNEDWSTFEERETFITQLKQPNISIDWLKLQPIIFDEKQNTNDDDVDADVDNIEIDEFEQNINNLELEKSVIELQKLNEDKTCQYPRFEFIVKLPDGTIIEEDFYNFQVTIALPAWPARFQDNEFRMFTENLLRSIAPAFLRLNFRWLGISRMKKFENNYFQFLDSLKISIHTNDERIKLSAAMTSWLKESYSKKTV